MKMPQYCWSLLSTCGLAVTLFVTPTLAQSTDGDNLPQPLPTNAATARTQAIEAFGSAPVDSQPCDQRFQHQYAYEVARLDTLFDLCMKASPTFRNTKTVDIDDLHEPLLMLGWLKQAKFVRKHRGTAKNMEVKAHNTSWALFEEKPPKGTVLYRADITGDGKPEEFILGPDGCIAVRCQGRIMGKTNNIGSFHGRTIGSGDQAVRHIDYTEVMEILEVKRLTPERIQIVVKEKISESLGSHLVGSYTCTRKYPLDVANSPQAPSVVIEKPYSLRTSKLKDVPLLGVVEAPDTIDKANLLLNGKEVWNIPEGLHLSKLTLDLSLNLQPGSNELLINVWDQQAKHFTKSVRFLAPPSKKVTANRALLIGVDSVGIQSVSNAREQLLQRGYIVKTLRGDEANRENISKAMDNMCKACKTGDRILVYFAGVADWNGTERIFLTSDDAANTTGASFLKDSDWERWHNELAPYRTCYIFDTVATSKLQSNGRGNMQDMHLMHSLTGLRNQIITRGNPDQHLGVPSSLNNALIKQWKGNPKADIFDLNRKAYTTICTDSERGNVLPLFGGY